MKPTAKASAHQMSLLTKIEISYQNCHLLSQNMYVDSLEQNCNNSSVLAMELLQSCAKPSILCFIITYYW